MKIIQTIEFWFFLISLTFGLIVYDYWDKSLRAMRKELFRIFRSNQIFSLTLMIRIKQLIEEFDASNAIYPERNLTYGTWLKFIEAEHTENYSDEKYNLARENKMSKQALQSWIDTLNKQNDALELLEIEIDLLLTRAREKRNSHHHPNG